MVLTTEAKKKIKKYSEFKGDLGVSIGTVVRWSSNFWYQIL